MSLLSSLISNLFNGVSQQAPELRLSSQAERQDNAISSPVDGLKKRPGTQHIGLLKANPGNPLVHFINRDATEQYAICIDNGEITAFDVKTGSKVPVSTPYGTEYLNTSNPSKDIKIVSLADYTFIVNTARTTQMTSEVPNPDVQLSGIVSFVAPVPHTPNVDPSTGGSSPEEKNTYKHNWETKPTPAKPDTYDKDALDELYTPPIRTQEPTQQPTEAPSAPGVIEPDITAPVSNDIGDGNLIEKLINLGFDPARHDVVAYNAPYEIEVLGHPENMGDPLANLSRYFPAGQTTFNTMIDLVVTCESRLYADGYTLQYDYDNGRFPMLFRGEAYSLMHALNPNSLTSVQVHAASFNGAWVYQNGHEWPRYPLEGAAGFNRPSVIIPTAIGVDAYIEIGTIKDNKYRRDILPIRLKLRGLARDVNASGGISSLNLYCAKMDSVYIHGKYLLSQYNNELTTPFDLWSIELERFLSVIETRTTGVSNTGVAVGGPGQIDLPAADTDGYLTGGTVTRDTKLYQHTVRLIGPKALRIVDKTASSTYLGNGVHGRYYLDTQTQLLVRIH